MTNIHPNRIPSSFNATAKLGITTHPDEVEELTQRIEALQAWEPAPLDPAHEIATTSDLGKTIKKLSDWDAQLATFQRHAGKAVNMLITEREQAIRRHADFYIQQAKKDLDGYVKDLYEHAPHLLEGEPMLNPDAAVHHHLGDHLSSVQEAARQLVQFAGVFQTLTPRMEGNADASRSAILFDPGTVAVNTIGKPRSRFYTSVPVLTSEEDKIKRAHVEQVSRTYSVDKTLALTLVARGEYPGITVSIPATMGEYLERVNQFQNLYQTATQ